MKKLFLGLLLALGLCAIQCVPIHQTLGLGVVTVGMFYGSGTFLYSNYKEWPLIKKQTAIQKMHYGIKGFSAVSTIGAGFMMGYIVILNLCS